MKLPLLDLAEMCPLHGKADDGESLGELLPYVR
jgi:hypothetical protein